MTTPDELERAALSGDHVSASELAHRFEAGEGVERNIEKALEWYRVAANLGSNSAAYILGCKYSDGVEVEGNSAIALGWFERAAELGDPAAHMHLAMIFTKGLLGQNPNKEKALLYSRRANECATAEISKHKARRAEIEGKRGKD
jgi:uncharacterized protein